MTSFAAIGSQQRGSKYLIKQAWTLSTLRRGKSEYLVLINTTLVWPGGRRDELVPSLSDHEK